MTTTTKLLMAALFACLLAGQPALAADPPVEADDHAAAAGGEKLSPIPTPKQAVAPAITTLVVFAVLLAILGKFAWGPIASGLKAREEKIRRDIADAEAARARAEATLQEYSAKLAEAQNQIRDMLAKANADAERVATNIRMQAQTESEEIKNRANKDIAAARDQAIAEVHTHTAELATAVAEKILRRNLNPDDQRELVNQSLEQLQTVKA